MRKFNLKENAARRMMDPEQQNTVSVQETVREAPVPGFSVVSRTACRASFLVSMSAPPHNQPLPEPLSEPLSEPLLAAAGMTSAKACSSYTSPSTMA